MKIGLILIWAIVFWILIPFVLTIFGCTQTPRQNVSKDSTIAKDTLATKSESKKIAPKIITIDLENYPSNYVVTEMGPDCEEERFFFYRDSSVAVEDMYGNSEYKFGKWRKTSDSIIMTLTYQTGYHGYELDDREKYLDSLGMDRCGPREYHILFPYEIEIKEKSAYKLTDFKDFYWMHVDSFHYAEDYPIADLYTRINGIYSFASKRLINSNDLKKYSKTALRLIKNEIFARYRYIFKSEDLDNYFRQQRWYAPKYVNVDEYLTDIERENIKFLVHYMQTH